jgi:NAD(P)-dependent dehydrogenase (short-subunit alcohol dehydrogenase family)
MNFIDKNKNLKKRVELIPIKRLAEPEEVAEYIYFLLSEKNTLLTQKVINISGGE